MVKRFALALLSLVISCPFCVAQTTVVDVKDVSTVKCPVRMSGTIEFTESEVDGVNHTSFVDKLSATNLSNAPIIAMVTYTVIGNSRGPLVGDDRQLDAFFFHDLEIAPGQTWTKTHHDNGEFIRHFLIRPPSSPLLLAARSYSFSSRMVTPAGTPTMDVSQASWMREWTCS